MARAFSSDNNNILEAFATGEPALTMQEIYDGAGVCIEQDMSALTLCHICQARSKTYHEWADSGEPPIF